jgi:hypothetical protein
MTSGTEKRRRDYQVGVRLLPEEYQQLLSDMKANGRSPGELLRRAYFTTASETVTEQPVDSEESQ